MFVTKHSHYVIIYVNTTLYQPQSGPDRIVCTLKFQTYHVIPAEMDVVGVAVVIVVFHQPRRLSFDLSSCTTLRPISGSSHTAVEQSRL